MAATSERTSILLLDATGSAETVFVMPEDRDNFCVTVEEAIKGCRVIECSYRQIRQFQELTEELHAWVQQRRGRIHDAYLTLRPTGALFVVVQREAACDHALVDELTDLDIRIANDRERFGLLNLDVLSVPRVSRESLTAFLTSGLVISYAEQSSAHASGPREPEGD